MFRHVYVGLPKIITTHNCTITCGVHGVIVLDGMREKTKSSGLKDANYWLRIELHVVRR